tara:strand:- start:1087 stop:1407 length:321 start_codon:yes stop_codon:yes gene_type:complete
MIPKEYNIELNLNEMIERRVPCCDLLHKDHCFTEHQVAEIAHDIHMDLNLHSVYHQIDEHIMKYVQAAGIDNKDHWVEERLPDLVEPKDKSIVTQNPFDEHGIDFE